MSYTLVTLKKDASLGCKVPNVPKYTDKTGAYFIHKCWIPSWGAKVGKKLKIDVEDEWDEPWVVESITDGIVTDSAASGMYNKLKVFKEMKVAGRRSYKD